MADWAKESDAAAAVMQAADRALGEQLSELIAHGPDTELNLPALLATSYAVFAAWKEAGGPTPEVMAGHSLGEYTALTAAGVFSIEDAVRLVRFRASAMQSAVPVGVGGMAAILGLSDEVVIDLCANAAQGEAVEAVNERQKSVLYRKLCKLFDNQLEGKRVAIWGLSFKPETDDMREAPSLVVINKLLEAGCVVSAYDPAAIPEAKRRLAGKNIRFASDIYDAVVDADVLLLLTEWTEFRIPSWQAIHKLMVNPLILDGRNIYDAKELKEYGFEYHCIGR